MQSIVECLLRNCFEGKSEEVDEDNDNFDNNDGHFIVTEPPQQISLNRGAVALYTPPPDNRSSLVETERGSCTGNNDGANGNQRHGSLNRPAEASLDENEASEYNMISSDSFGNLTPGISNFVQRVRQGLRDAQGQLGLVSNDEMEGMLKGKRPLVVISPSPLRAAHNFTQRPSSENIPSIAQEEVVLPGSDLQRQMSDSLQKNGYGSELEEDECVICMEAFDVTNPRMPTHCGCGDNKTYFHLPCLYQWVEQSNGQNRSCPTCRQPLTWEEL